MFGIKRNVNENWDLRNYLLCTARLTVVRMVRFMKLSWAGYVARIDDVLKVLAVKHTVILTLPRFRGEVNMRAKRKSICVSLINWIAS
jgi:hypothetical protein